MRSLTLIALAVVLTTSLPTMVHANADPAAALAWLAGCWASEGAEPGSGEQWMPPAGGTLPATGAGRGPALAALVLVAATVAARRLRLRSAR